MRGLWSIAVATLRLFTVADGAVARSLQHQPPIHQVDRDVQPPAIPLELTNTAPGTPIKPGTELRILAVGDSITYGFLSDQDGGDGNGYRLRLRQYLSSETRSLGWSCFTPYLVADTRRAEDKVVYAGTETSPTGNMTGGYFAAWNGKTIQYIADNVGPSLEQRPNIILLHAGTNDMNPNSVISTEGHDPVAASERLGSLIDKMTAACPDAVILIAMIIGTCNAEQSPQTKAFQSLVPKVVTPRLQAGKHVLAVDFSTFGLGNLRDCIHPTNQGYQLVGYYWYDFIAQIPRDWITAPAGKDPEREESFARRLHADTPLLGVLGLLSVLMYAWG